MSAHTPGPWEVGDLDRNGQRVVRGEMEVATCWHHCLGPLEPVMEANARLIAAAPDGLEAVERCLEHYSDALPVHMVEEFRAFAAKARGAE